MTLVEAILGVAVLSLFLAACFSSILFNRVASMKAKEEAVANNFLLHYAENLKGLAFEDVRSGIPINPMFNGLAGAPNIRIPATNSWANVDTADFETFHPDLVWLHYRNPQLRVDFTTETSGGVARTKHLKLRLAWDPPLNRGGRLDSSLLVPATVEGEPPPLRSLWAVEYSGFSTAGEAEETILGAVEQLTGTITA